jgi:hypothetical protein
MQKPKIRNINQPPTRFNKTIKKQGTPSLEGVKQVLRSKKEDSECMKVGHFYYCDHCGKPIYNSEDGIIVHGNIYVADPTMRGGLIGNNFPNVAPGTKIEVTDVREQVFCLNCINSIFKNIKTLNSSEVVEDWTVRHFDNPVPPCDVYLPTPITSEFDSLNSDRSPYRSADDLESLLGYDEAEAVPADHVWTLPDGSPMF